MDKKFRTEKDTLGDYPVPADAWYGIQTARAVDNFPISGRGPDRDFIIAHARIKRAAAVANREAGWLDPHPADATPPTAPVNRGRRTNDPTPPAIRLACLAKLPRLLAAVESMAAEYEAIAKREAQTIKSGRTHLQDAVPTTLGREFGAYAVALRRCTETLQA